jgi:hypothetical protein
MRYLFFLLFSSFSFLGRAQFTTNIYWTEQSSIPASEVIYYSKTRPLGWKDFRGNPDAASPASAMTASGFGYKADYNNVGPKTTINISIYCYFNKKNSWVKPGRTTEYILNHEQQHFDISFIAASLFFEKLKTTSLNKSNYNLVLPNLYKECCTIMNKMQDEYDGQTKNGQLKDEQERWNNFLRNKIKVVTK